MGASFQTFKTLGWARRVASLVTTRPPGAEMSFHDPSVQCQGDEMGNDAPPPPGNRYRSYDRRGHAVTVGRAREDGTAVERAAPQDAPVIAVVHLYLFRLVIFVPTPFPHIAAQVIQI
jgi:hypothetical protein